MKYLAICFLFSSCIGIIQKNCGDDLRRGCDLLVGEEAGHGRDGSHGENGKDGVDGRDGVDGKDGVSCEVVPLANGAQVTCGDSSVVIEDGEDHDYSAYDISEIVDPCGDYPGHADEVLLRTYGGEYLSYFEDGSKRFLSVLEFGKNYVTTDRQRCRFMLSTSQGLIEL